MGLGPPVCQHCQVLAYYKENKGYYCTYCGETKITESAGFSDKRWKELEQNERVLKRFYNFMKGKDPNGLDCL